VTTTRTDKTLQKATLCTGSRQKPADFERQFHFNAPEAVRWGVVMSMSQPKSRQTDSDLLTQYADNRDAEAFAEISRRYERLVWNCSF